MDIKCQHITTGEVKTLPEKVFAQVQHKYKYLATVAAEGIESPNALPPPPVANAVVPVVVDKEGGREYDGIESSKTLEEVRQHYWEATGKKPGNKGRLTLQKEINELL